jgi:hypothetical protein
MRAALGLLLALAACGGVSDIADYGNGSFGLTATAASAAGAARDGVERARAHCAARHMALLPQRSLIGMQDYQLVFRCLPPGDPALRQQGG